MLLELQIVCIHTVVCFFSSWYMIGSGSKGWMLLNPMVGRLRLFSEFTLTTDLLDIKHLLDLEVFSCKTYHQQNTKMVAWKQRFTGHLYIALSRVKLVIYLYLSNFYLVIVKLTLYILKTTFKVCKCIKCKHLNRSIPIIYKITILYFLITFLFSLISKHKYCLLIQS